MSRIGTFYSGYGGIRVPVGTALTDAGSLAAASAIQVRNGSSFSRTGNSALYTAWKQAGYLGAKDASFNASTTSIVQMTADNLPSGYIASTNMTEHNPGENWHNFDRNAATYAYYDNTYGYIQLEHPAITILGYSLEYGNTGYQNYMTVAGRIEESIDGTNFIQTAMYENFTPWGAVSRRDIIPTTPINSVKTRLTSFGSNYNNINIFGNFNIYGADLSVIKCVAHGFNTGDKVRVTGTTLPTGLAGETDYYTRQGADANKCTLYDTQAHAISGGATGLITITDAGSGTFKIYPADNPVLDTLTNGKLYY